MTFLMAYAVGVVVFWCLRIIVASYQIEKDGRFTALATDGLHYKGPSAGAFRKLSAEHYSLFFVTIGALIWPIGIAAALAFGAFQAAAAALEAFGNRLSKTTRKITRLTEVIDDESVA